MAITSINSSQINSFQKYLRRPGADDCGRDYEIKITALISLRCAIMKNSEDLWFGSNVDEVGDFDDIVLFRKTTEGICTAYLIQLKHQDNPKNINQSDFIQATKNKGKRKKSKDFSLAKYSESYLDLKNKIAAFDSDASNQSEIVRHLREADKVIFVLFTNRGVNPCDFLQKVCANELCFLNTCYNNLDNVYKFSNEDYDPDFLDCLMLFINQAHLKDVDGLIQTEIKKLMGAVNVTNVDLKRVNDKFTVFIRNWTKAISNTKFCYSLNKCDIINKICEILLEPYTVDFSRDVFTFYNCPRKAEWNKIINNMKITLTDNNESICVFLREYFGSEIIQHCPEVVKTWSDNLSKRAQNLLYTQHVNLHMEIIRCNHQVTLYDFYKYLWLIRKLPLLLQINNEGDYQHVARILKVLNYTLPIIILKNELLQITIKETKCFTNLSDLNEPDIVLNQFVRLQGRFAIKLRDIIDKTEYKELTCRDIINILSGTFSIGNEHEPLPKYYIQRSLSRVLLKQEVIQNINDEIFLLDDVPNEKLNDFIISNCHTVNKDQVKTSKIVHHLRFYNDKYLEWKQSFGNTCNIQQYTSEEKLWIQLSDIKEQLQLYIISAAPGMGKSTYINYIAHQVPANTWVLRVNLNDYDKYYESRQFKKAQALDHLKYFASNDNNKLSKVVFQKLLDKKQVLVLLDGFDEISISYKKEVTKMAAQIHKEGFNMWITTRPVMKSHLEEEFNTIALTLKPFTITDQKDFLCAYFTVIIPRAHEKTLKEFVTKLLKAAKVNLNDKDCEFTGVPLQTKLLADVFTNECRASLTDGIVRLRERFDLLYLYDKFIKNKTDIVCDKFGKGIKQVRVLFEKHQQLFALKLLFHKDDLLELNIDKELDEYYHNKQSKVQFLQREGVLVVHTSNTTTEHKFDVRFMHRTFAEYLAAQWLAQNFDDEDLSSTIRIIMQKRFPPPKLHPFLFTMFDRILTINCPLHTAIINERLEEIPEYFDEANTFDEAGRSVLHIIALYGFQHPYQALFNLSTTDRMVDVLEILPIDTKIVDLPDDIYRINALDYAIKNYTLAIANKLCEKFPILTLTIQTNQATRDLYFSYCTWLEYKSLFQVLIPYYAIQGIILPFVDKCEAVGDIYQGLFEETNEFIVATISEMLSDNYNYNNLHFAVAFGTESNIRHLLTEGRDINEYDFLMNTSLHYATIRNRFEIVCLLINGGADINKIGKYLNTPLHCAAESGANEIITELIKKGADINCVNTNDDTPILWAFLSNHRDTVKLLMAKGADINMENCNGYSILHYAAELGYDDIILELLEKGDDINKMNSCHETPLYLAILNNHYDTVKLLLTRGASLENEQEKKDSSLHYAAMSNNADFITELLSRGADINKKNEKAQTPLHFALRARKNHIAQLLLKKGALTSVDINGTSCLHLAAQAGADDLIKKLDNADINLINNEGKTPLHFAIEGKHESTVKLLLLNGAEDIIKSKNQNSGLHYAAELSNKEIILALLNRGFEFNKENHDGDTPLHFAVQRGHPDFIKFLISDTTINKQNKFGRSPLHTSIVDQRCFIKEEFENQKLVVDLLIDQGANVNLQDSEGNTALHHACTDHFTGMVNFMMTKERKLGMIYFYEEVVKSVLKNGAKTDFKNNENKTAFDLANEANYASIVRLLTENIE